MCQIHMVLFSILFDWSAGWSANLTRRNTSSSQNQSIKMNMNTFPNIDEKRKPKSVSSFLLHLFMIMIRWFIFEIVHLLQIVKENVYIRLNIIYFPSFLGYYLPIRHFDFLHIFSDIMRSISISVSVQHINRMELWQK